MNENVTALMKCMRVNHQRIKALLKEKCQMIGEVQTAMDHKARTKTPLNERQQQIIHEFAGTYAREGGILQQSLMNIKNTINSVHTESTEAIVQSLVTLHAHQNYAIHSLRRMIESSKNALRSL